MSKRLQFLLFLLALVLAACAKQAPADAPTETATPEPASQPTKVQIANCIVPSAQATPNPTLEAILPPISASDQAKGPTDAYVTLIEYGDFQ